MKATERKEALRNELLERRKSISGEHYKDASQRIRSGLMRQPEYREANSIHCYVSLNDRGEIDTHPLIREMLQSEKRVVVPVTDFDNDSLRHVVLRDYNDLSPNKWGVPEPGGGKEIDPVELDLVVVPMVGGDQQCNRLGYGKGFYDRFLAQTDCPTIGLCFDECIVGEIPVEPFDVRLDKIITQERVIG